MLDKSYGGKSVYAVLSTLPIGQKLTLYLDYVSTEGAWAGFVGNNATIISPVDNDIVYIPLVNIRAVLVQ